MNYYNPYFFYPNASLGAPTANIIGNIGRGNFSFSSLLNGAQRTLNFVNQAIPVVKQVSPMMKNAKTMFRVMNEFKKVESPTTTTKDVASKKMANSEKIIADSTTNSFNDTTGPTFFM